jgi:hypothetical protein
VRRIAAALAGLALAAAGTDLAGTVLAAVARQGRHEAAFHEERRLPSLTEPVTGEGVLHIVPPDTLVKETRSPRPERLAIAGDEAVVTAADGTRRSVSLADTPPLRALAATLRAVLGGDAAALRRMYRVEAEGSEAGWRLTLLPLPGTPAGTVRRVTIDGAAGQVRQIELLGEDGSQDVLSLSAAR